MHRAGRTTLYWTRRLHSPNAAAGKGEFSEGHQGVRACRQYGHTTFSDSAHLLYLLWL